jgi:YD repeat-containing protein
VTEVAYDRFGRVAAEKQGTSRVQFEYDALGRRTARTVAVDGVAPRTTRYAYAPDGALSGVEHQGQQIAIEQDVMGREVRKHVYGAGVDIQSRYDALDRLVEQRVTGPEVGGVPAAPQGRGGQGFRELVRRAWQYDALGRPASVEDARWGTTAYAYDEIGNLVQARRGKALEVFDYDPTGSLQKILDRLEGPPRPSWDLREGNRLTRTEGARFRDDDRGRRIQKIDFAEAGDPGARGKPRPGNRVTLYGWDARDRLREVVLPDGPRSDSGTTPLAAG